MLYKFSQQQLRRLLDETIGLYQEYHHQHGRIEAQARLQAVQDTLEGLDAERELFLAGEIQRPGQTIERASE